MGESKTKAFKKNIQMDSSCKITIKREVKNGKGNFYTIRPNTNRFAIIGVPNVL